MHISVILKKPNYSFENPALSCPCEGLGHHFVYLCFFMVFHNVEVGSEEKCQRKLKHDGHLTGSVPAHSGMCRCKGVADTSVFFMPLHPKGGRWSLECVWGMK